MTEAINFISSPSKHGGYFIFHIPNKLIKHNLIDPNQTYRIKLVPLKSTKSKKKAKAAEGG